MHGMIFGELKKFVDHNLGGDAWNVLLKETELEGKLYTPVQEYPDEELVALVATASKITGQEIKPLLTAFGRFIVPDLLRLYRRQMKPEWSVLYLLAHVEDTIHKVVRLRNPGASPPKLRVEQVNEKKSLFITRLHVSSAA